MAETPTYPYLHIQFLTENSCWDRDGVVDLRDAWAGNALALLPPEQWGEEETVLASELIHRYRPVGDLPPRPDNGAVAAARAAVEARLGDDATGAPGPRGRLFYDPAAQTVAVRPPARLSVHAALKTVSGWERRRTRAGEVYVWVATRLPELIPVADRHGIDVTAATRALAETLARRRASAAVEDLDGRPSIDVDPERPGTLLVRAEFDPRLNAELREVNDGVSAWDPRVHAHRVPYRRPEDILRLAERYGLTFSDAATAAIQAEIRRQERNRAAATLIRTTETLPVHGIRDGKTLLPTQNPAVLYATEHRRVFIGDDMGWGKTVEALATVAAAMAYPAVVVCPPSLTHVWRDHVAEWLPWLNVWIADSESARPVPPDTDVIIIGYAALAVRERPPLVLDAHERRLAREDPGQAVPADRAAAAARYLVRQYGSAEVATRDPATVRLVADLADGRVDAVTRAQEARLADMCARAPASFTWVPHLAAAGPRALILDEGHSTKEGAALRTRAVYLLSRAIPGDGYVLSLSGTGIVNHPRELATQLEIMGRLEEFGGMRAFLWRYCQDGGGGRAGGGRHLVELNRLLTGYGIMVRRSGMHHLGVPECTEEKLLLWPDQLDPQIMAEYRRAERDIVGYLAEEAQRIAGELGVDAADERVKERLRTSLPNHLVRLNVLRRLVGRAKRLAVADYVAKTSQREKVIVAAHHRDVVGYYAARFGGLRIQGGQPVEEKERHKATFQADPDARVIVITDTAGQYGHTLTAATVTVLAEQVWTPGDRRQVKHRMYRLGQTRPTRFVDVIAVGTVDERMARVVAEKQAVLDAVLDGRADTAVDASLEGVGLDVLWAYVQAGLAGEVERARIGA